MGDRRAINTPIQGGAADIVIASMVKISRNQKLKELGWKLLMQIHD
jgi:DNA polymerase-1